MAKVKIDAVEALRDIRSGMDDVSLMKKYNLSAKGLESLYGKLLGVGALKRSEVDPKFKVEVKARDVLADIRSGMTKVEFVNKYRLSGKGMQSLFEKMVLARILTQPELDHWMASNDESKGEGASAVLSDADDWMSSFEETVDLSWLEKKSKL
ncbi:MAG: hypothetical protein FJY85_02060 [Deltaproteobacteria bacterium]|nr:hypothetical protein [Deltaproteobacteria bacterium]